MGRGKVQLKRIDNNMSRQVTFSKRRAGLLKKANEISVLCDADVALIIFSAKGKLYEYATDSSMERILDRHEQYFYAERELLATNQEPQKSRCLEFSKLKLKIESLHKSQRQLIGEDLDTLTIKELQYLEQQLESGLKQVRARKNHLLFDSISELQRKEKILQDQNCLLEKKLKGKGKEKTVLPQEEKEQIPLATDPLFPPTPNFNFEELLPTLNIGISEERATAQKDKEMSHVHALPIWMLRPVNR